MQTPPPSQDRYLGQVIDGKYRCEEKIGEGGMGVIYRGTQVSVGRTIAIKLLHPQFAEMESLRARFEVEAKAVAQLNHPNCITLYDFGFAQELGAFYTIVEYVDGHPLSHYFVAGKPLPSFSESVDVIKQIAAGLEHAHLHGILHRDLKPENVMMATTIKGQKIAKVLDFGIAQIIKGAHAPKSDTQRLTEHGMILGTPSYMSPEHAYGERELTPACDFYSLGIIFYELIDGRLPFTGRTPLEFMMKHVQDAPPVLNRRDVPDDLQRILYWMLAKDPAARPQSGQELLDALAHVDLETASGKSAYHYLSAQEAASAPTSVRDGDDLQPETNPPQSNAATDETWDAPTAQFTSLEEIPKRERTPPPSTPDEHPPRSRKTLVAVVSIIFVLLVSIVAAWVFFARADSEQITLDDLPEAMASAEPVQQPSPDIVDMVEADSDAPGQVISGSVPPTEAGSEKENTTDSTPEVASVEEKPKKQAPKKKDPPPRPARVGALLAKNLTAAGYSGVELSLQVSQDFQITGSLKGQREGKSFTIPIRGAVSRNGTITASGRQEGNRASINGTLDKSGARGIVQGTVFEHNYSMRYRAE